MYFLCARAFHLSRPSCSPSFGEERKLQMYSLCNFLHLHLYSLSGSPLLEISYVSDKFRCEIPLIIKTTGHRFGNRSIGLPAKRLVDFKCQFNPTNHRPIDFITRPLTGSKFSIWKIKYNHLSINTVLFGADSPMSETAIWRYNGPANKRDIYGHNTLLHSIK